METVQHAEDGFHEGSAVLGEAERRTGWSLMIDLRQAPSFALDSLVDAAIARLRPLLLDGFSHVVYVVGDTRRRMQVERAARRGPSSGDQLPDGFFSDETEALLFLRDVRSAEG